MISIQNPKSAIQNGYDAPQPPISIHRAPCAAQRGDRRFAMEKNQIAMASSEEG